MTAQDGSAFGLRIAALAEALGEPMSDLRTEAYFGALSDLPLAAVIAAMQAALTTCRFFPKPVELRELVEGTAQDGAEAAWAAVGREIRRVGYMGIPRLEERALRAVNEVWGSWERLCSTLPAEGPELVGWRKMYLAAYQSGARRDVTTQALTMAGLAPGVRALVEAKRALPDA